MTAIAGIFATQSGDIVERMLARMRHRAQGEIKIHTSATAALGVIHKDGMKPPADKNRVEDRISDRHYSFVQEVTGQPFFERDFLGIVPLYYGRREDGALCFASEVKGLLEATGDINEFPPGCSYDGKTFARFFKLKPSVHLSENPDRIAAELRVRLEKAVQKRIFSDETGCYLSGGLDSSIMAALARRHVRKLWSVAAGVAGAPDLEAAREVADFIKADHQEVIVTPADMLRILPDVIWHLESFDALLVRSSIMQYFASQRLIQHATDAFSGEGGDELFAGYAYMKNMTQERLNDELIESTGRLHNTALQRVDRCSTAHGLRAHVCFLDPAVVEYALQIPTELKLRAGVEKWIVRQAFANLLPERIIKRAKVKFWEGAGVQDLLAQHAQTVISDGDFSRERTLPNGWVLGSKEELMYYRIFCERLGPIPKLDWMGRTPSS
ncbi:MAG: asparagine synthase [Deltaproteobacteria bacterium HGW-Deltaproteobacteria-12]|jgi:asparagine synthase (glutamine-hydrolysing)|nr:MAG: asparagine synthase [Deltaproteobacteria bacterium HGW-Deltaproteobacteria-12]